MQAIKLKLIWVFKFIDHCSDVNSDVNRDIQLVDIL